MFWRPNDPLGMLQAGTFRRFVLGELQDDGVALRLSHFAGCPEAERFKRSAA